MKNFTLSLIFFGLLSPAFAQYKSGAKVNEYLDLAKEAFEYDEWQQCVEYYEKVDSSARALPIHHWMLGVSYLHSNHNENALRYLLAAEKNGYIDKEKPWLEYDLYHAKWHSPDLDFNIGWAYHLHHKFEKALDYYQKFEDKFKSEYGSKVSKHKEEIDAIEHMIEQAKNGAILVKDPIEGIVIENLGPNINSEFEEIVPLISADEKTLIFTARRPNTTGKGIDTYDGKFMEDIYISRKKDGSWRKPWKISKKINTPEHDACIGLSPNGKKLLIYKNNNRGTGDIYLSELNGRIWSTPEKLPDGINTKYVENSASMSADGRWIFFTSSREEGSLGHEDLWYSQRKPDGTWGEPVNCGPNVNTIYDEDAPFIHPDGRTLYFSSRGHNSMGGFDIFQSKFDPNTGSFSKPTNMGFPINTADDDIFFVWSPDGKRAYFASHREDSYGDQDIYMLTHPDASMSVILLKGIVVAKHNQMPLRAKIVATDNKTEEIIHEQYSNEETGEFVMILEPGRNYGIYFERKGYLPETEHIDLPDLDKYYERNIKVEMQLLSKGAVTILKNVFFENNRAELFEESHIELDRFVAMLQENPLLDAEVAGHTEIGGIKANNLDLSQRRAQAVVDYLVSKGISKKRLKPIGYGAKYPLSTGNTAEEKQKNRRTEIILHNTEEEGKNWTGYYDGN